MICYSFGRAAVAVRKHNTRVTRQARFHNISCTHTQNVQVPQERRRYNRYMAKVPIDVHKRSVGHSLSAEYRKYDRHNRGCCSSGGTKVSCVSVPVSWLTDARFSAGSVWQLHAHGAAKKG
ncbi:hypothetical protein IscW_ISCW021295 [Ixodes scapularis]|uniref:Uncharacterized protein n=1 Tax=Ixodes scapularis TaxID=6945 RepID=B7Q9A0_IXOSC|nr:hypothetical protein IscW_ISCW021295 [Ixodes scapularis]|eukprot:XP_002405676.1 hypothetical protein IscW_ISCW021295 [Ixodes scapularis]